MQISGDHFVGRRVTLTGLAGAAAGGSGALNGRVGICTSWDAAKWRCIVELSPESAPNGDGNGNCNCNGAPLSNNVTNTSNGKRVVAVRPANIEQNAQEIAAGVGRCRSPVSNPDLKARLVLALETNRFQTLLSNSTCAATPGH